MSEGNSLKRKRDSDDSPPAPEDRETPVFAMVCSSNMNRSMEAHKQLTRKGLTTFSYGVGSMVRLPGPKGQAIFAFGTPYEKIREVLTAEDNGRWYRERGLLALVERNILIKSFPERWQEIDDLPGKFDVVFCFEERVFELLMEDVGERDPGEMTPMHVINLDVKDTPEDSVIGGQLCLEFCLKCNQYVGDELEEKLPDIVEEVMAKSGRNLTHMTVYL